MYNIFKLDGTLLGVTDKINYIKINPNNLNVYIPAIETEAIGIVFKNIKYNLVGQSNIPEAEEVIINEIDATYILENYTTWADLAKAYEEGVQNA